MKVKVKWGLKKEISIDADFRPLRPFDAAVVFFMKFSTLLRLALAILASLTVLPVGKVNLSSASEKLNQTPF